MAIYSTIQQQNAINMKYKKKLKKLKKFIENLVFENAALCDQVAQVQESIVTVKEERRFLLKRLMDRDPDLAKELSKKQTASETGTPTQSTRKPYKKRAKKQQQAAQVSETISLDSNENDGTSFPIDLGALKILSIGQIITDRPNYHTEHSIYPSGFVSTRSFNHIKEKDGKCLYTCRITENGDIPRFEIIPEPDPEFIIAGPTPSLCHAALIQTINDNTGQNLELHAQGEWFFGLTHSTVTNILQNMPDIKSCSKFKGFDERPQSFDLNVGGHSVNYDAFEKDINISNYHTVLEVKEEPPDELF